MSKAATARKTGTDRVSLTPEDWEKAALALIADKGVAALAVEPLARRLQITKGSFYWHFPGRDELLCSALKRWEQQDADHLERSLAADENPAERLARFVWRTTRQTLTHRVYLALCALPDDFRIGPVLKRVTARRIQYLAAAFEQLGLGPEAAQRRATLVYSGYVGYLQLQAQKVVPERDEPAFDAYVEHVIETLITPSA
ncbi:MAG: TetR/AcrR family transcriptional regulator [Wenzhouxiangella sp.]|nr:TetR/AcrR family transcriptional regulator [Wenzhouxiangella sp.]